MRLSLPRWAAANDSTYVMGGDAPSILLAEYAAFDARNFDRAAALRLLRQAALRPTAAVHGFHEREHLEQYLKLGYSPAGAADAAVGDISASETLELANADFAAAQFARSMHDTQTADLLEKHAGNWRNLFDPKIHWIHPRRADGTFIEGFDAEKSLPVRKAAPVPNDQAGFEEGNTYQYTFMLPFDYRGLFRAIGDDAETERRLDRFFSKLIGWGEPNFNMANEPDFVTPYAYTFLGKPWKTASVLTRVENETFTTAPDGLPGNDDLGATSGVYLWNVLGIYPAIPGLGGVVLGTPRFPRAVLHMGHGKTLQVERSGDGIYVDSVTLNGKPYASSWLPIAGLHTGTNTLHFNMSTKPGSAWATAEQDRPPSLTPR